ncbi:hypothetical protein J3A83DRAFT_1414775 [Scleroderma citrinum]
MSIRPTTSSSTSSIPTSTSTTSSPITLEALLAQHASAPDPFRAALDQALSERNVFASQNTQLWKLIEKQRSGYNQVLKELDRVRAERDAYKGRLMAAGLSVDLGKKEKQNVLRTSASNAAISSAAQEPTDPRADMTRRQSDNSAPSFRDRRPSTPSKGSEHLDTPDQELQAPQGNHSRTPVSPVVVPPRSASLPQGTPTPTSKHTFSSISSPEAQPRSSDGSATSQPGAVLQPRSPGTPRMDTISPSQHITSPSGHITHPAALTPHNPPPNTLAPIIEDPRLSQESSKLHLANETRQHGINAGESPLPSPNHTGSSVSPFSASDHGQSTTDLGSSSGINGHHQERSSPSKPARIYGDGSDEFLDMGASDENQTESHDIHDQQMQTSPHPSSPSKKKHRTRATVEDFPMPPLHGPVPLSTHHHNSSGHSPTTVVVQAQSPRDQKQPHVLSHSPSLEAPSTHTVDSPLLSSYLSPTKPSYSSSGVFRALPLVQDDLKTTRITVLHSSVKPNDRGKDVLSFVIEVDPRNAKDPWKVEKLYSDFLGLDQRMRNAVGKNVAKKMGVLPEGKVWRDHAPAKADQRKAALEVYLQSLINLPVRNKDEVIAFFTSDIVRETKRPVMQAGYKEGYLTKRGKNFGGWKTRYFVLQGPVLEYYESRGGAHLGSIIITGAQIGRQQRTNDNDDEKNYRHAFLIIEAKKGPSGSPPRHVLCAESDVERDSWVDILVRYVSGTFNEDAPSSCGPSPISVNVSQGQGFPQPRSSSSSQDAMGTPISKRGGRSMSKDDISKGHAVPISQLAPDANNAKLFQTAPIPESDGAQAHSASPTKLSHPQAGDRDYVTAEETSKRLLERSGGASMEPPLSTSLPTTSPLDFAGQGLVSFRANSEMGHYVDMDRGAAGNVHDQSSSIDQGRSREGRRDRKSHLPALISPVASTFPDRVPSPDVGSTPLRSGEANGKVKISAPINGAPIPLGYKFGSRDAPGESSSSNDRREKAKSRSFWNFGRPTDKVVSTPRNVFGVPLEESLDVAEIARLPAVVFRCIQYLEAKHAEEEEGIYRLSGSSAVIKGLRDRFNAEGDVDLLGSDEYWDPHAISGLLKTFLRELPASILTRELHMKFLAVMDFVEPQERIRELSFLIASLPIANYSLLRALTAHLILIVQNSSLNKMTMRNVGIVFSPTLGIPAGVFSLMLGEFNRVFNVDAENDVSEEKADELSRRNSRQYSDAAADQLLGLSGRSLNNAAADEAPSEEEGDSISLQYESGNDTTENEMTVESSHTWSSANPQSHYHYSPQNTDTSSPVRSDVIHTSERRSHASNVAASRGLNIAIAKKINRQSRMLGLPVSPRPPTESPHSPALPSSIQTAKQS